MISTVLLFAAATSVVITQPQRIPAWCALGAVVVSVFTIYYARLNNKNPYYLLIQALSSLLIGVAGPRPTLQYFGVETLHTWYPETFVLLGAVFGMTGFTLLSTSHLLITGELPGVIRSIWRRIVGPISNGPLSPIIPQGLKPKTEKLSTGKTEKLQ